MTARRRKSVAGFFHRAFAWTSAALVLALAIFAASPELHHRLHVGQNGSTDDGCAIVLFAGGVSLPVGIATALPPSVQWRARSAAVAEEIFLASPRYLRQPERGPPGA